MDALPDSPNFRVDGQRVLVIGAGRGIGLALRQRWPQNSGRTTSGQYHLPDRHRDGDDGF